MGVFPSSDHFPLGRAYGRVETIREPASAVRPFGLTLAVQPREVTRVDPAELGYDEDAQVGLIRDGASMVPLSKHTDGQTNTVTQGGDGQTTNRDSDTDHRED
ncbi:MAG: putative ATP-grasp-modified RiPP [Pseudonocardiaceae bacterium]